MDIETLISQADRSRIYVKHQTLCKTLAGNNVPVLTITNIPQYTDDVDRIKQEISSFCAFISQI